MRAISTAYVRCLALGSYASRYFERCVIRLNTAHQRFDAEYACLAVRWGETQVRQGTVRSYSKICGVRNLVSLGVGALASIPCGSADAEFEPWLRGGFDAGEVLRARLLAVLGSPLLGAQSGLVLAALRLGFWGDVDGRNGAYAERHPIGIGET